MLVHVIQYSVEIQPPHSTHSSSTLRYAAPPFCRLITKICQVIYSYSCSPETNSHQYCDNYLTHLVKTYSLAIVPQLFHSKLKTLFFNKSNLDSSSSPYLSPHLNSKHPSRLPA